MLLMRRIIAAMLLLFLLAGLSTGCRKETAPQEAVSTPALDSQETEETTGPGLYPVTSSGVGGAMGAETEAGVYSLDTYGDGSADIIYYDYATASCVRLSSDPNLGHDPASTAYVPNVSGGIRCAVSGENLYLLQSGSPYSQDKTRTALYYRMDLNGANRTRTELGGNLVMDFSLPMVGDRNGNLYFIGYIVDTETITVQTALLKIGPGVSGYEILARWEGESVVLAGEYGDGFVLDDWSLEENRLVHRFFTLDPETGEEVPFSMDTTAIASYTLQEGILYYTLDQDSAIYCYDIGQGTPLPELAVTLPQGGQPSWARITGMVRDDHLPLFLGDPDGGEGIQGGLDLETGSFSPVTLSFGEGDDWMFASICGEGESWFMIKAGKEPRTLQRYGTEGAPYLLETEVPVYAVISKEDYWNDRHNYQIFQRYE